MLADKIKDILYGYVMRRSISYSPGEREAEEYFLDFFGKQEYFQAHPRYYGAFPIEGDPFGRRAVWAMVKGKGPDTVVLLHHYDVVTVEDFKTLKDYAFTPDELGERLMEIKDSLADEAREDLESGKWLFGRGVCDMKGGGSVQMALLSEYAGQEDFQGNVIVLGVPDEENLSAGMRAGVLLLDRMKKEYGLKYKLMINSEPHQRKTKEEGVFSFGSIGKLMPFVYVRGCLAHAGKVFEGLNPVNIMCEIVRGTEVQMEFSDVVGKEAAPPPTWLYLRETKQSYDVSMPLSVHGCLSILTLNQSPESVMAKVRKVCEDSFETVLADMNRNYRRFAKAAGRPETELPWKSKVVDFGGLIREAKENYGGKFEAAYAEELRSLHQRIRRGEESLITANFGLVEFVYNYIDDLSPRVVIGLMPPYYPNTANILRQEKEGKAAGLYDSLKGFARERWGQEYGREDFYTGISDLSYSGISGSGKIEESLKNNMPFFGEIYNLPLAEMQNISMPCVNIGPWGKDFHKLTERVYKEDLYERTPEILDFAVKAIIGEKRKRE